MKKLILFFLALIMTVTSVPLSVFAADGKYDYSFFSGNNIIGYNPQDNTCSTSTDNRQQTWDFLTSKGLTPQQAAGIMGNLQTESANSWSPIINELGQTFGNGGLGLAQWTNYLNNPGGRRDILITALKTAAPDAMAKYYTGDYSAASSITNQAAGFVPKSAANNTPMDTVSNDALLLAELNYLYTDSSSRTVSSAAIAKGLGTKGETEWDAITKQTTVAGASNLWVYSFEIPANIDTTAAARVVNGQAILTTYTTDSTSDDGSCDEPTATTTDITIDQANILKDSTNVPCGTGTVDAGLGDGYYNGTKVSIHLCSLPNTIDQNHKNQPAKVNSRVSGAFYAMTSALLADKASTPVRRTGKLLVSDSFRTYAEQVAACKANPGVACAKAGYSNHQLGLAIDFKLNGGYGKAHPVGDVIYDWLTAHAAQYGFKQLSTEGWHWQPTAAKG